MTPEQALKIVNDATGQLQANRETHSLIMQALAVLKDAIAPKPEPKQE
jgi:hypothetical protein